jgi:hypothetical protein
MGAVDERTRRLLTACVDGVRDRPPWCTSSPAAAATASPPCPTSALGADFHSVIGRAFLAACTRLSARRCSTR